MVHFRDLSEHDTFVIAGINTQRPFHIRGNGELYILRDITTKFEWTLVSPESKRRIEEANPPVVLVQLDPTGCIELAFARSNCPSYKQRLDQQVEQALKGAET
ncbi:MAG TPA: hypothetical protein PK109_03255 [Candidatus Paceibacterota bacterium]|nr:hypothetical protein [Candidatus Paceibacterota bacterium]